MTHTEATDSGYVFNIFALQTQSELPRCSNIANMSATGAWKRLSNNLLLAAYIKLYDYCF